MLRKVGDAKLSLLEIEHLRGGLDLLQVNLRGEQPLDEVIFDDGDGGIIIILTNRGFDQSRQVVPLLPQRCRQFVESPSSIGEEGQGTPGVESRRHELDRPSQRKIRGLLCRPTRKALGISRSVAPSVCNMYAAPKLTISSINASGVTSSAGCSGVYSRSIIQKQLT
jgi:hypothetical protein